MMQANEEDIVIVRDSSTMALRNVMDTVQLRWAKVLQAMFSSDLEEYARGACQEPPLSMHNFCAILQFSEEVLVVCMQVQLPATAMQPLLQCFGDNLLVVSSLPNTQCPWFVWVNGIAQTFVSHLSVVIFSDSVCQSKQPAHQESTAYQFKVVCPMKICNKRPKNFECVHTCCPNFCFQHLPIPT
jgi:hypothetical protein